jgi:multicomponent Na+:H+ antiporter subunit D
VSLTLPFLVPLFGGALSFLCGTRSARGLHLAFCAGTAGCALWLVLRVWRQGTERLELGGIQAPLGILLRGDSLAAVLLLTTAVVGLGVSLWALGWHPKAPGSRPVFFSLWLFLWGALNALFVSSDLFNLYVTLELVGLGAVGLVVVEGGRQSLRAGMTLVGLPPSGGFLGKWYLLSAA